LLQSAQNLKKQKKNLYFENEKEYLELSGDWEYRRLMQNFINGCIDGEEFKADSFDALEFQINSKKLKDFQPDSRSKGFGSLISFLRAECDNFEEDYDNKEFYDSIKDCFLKLQKALNVIMIFLIVLDKDSKN
jgi:hypothetical protein